ncbi:MAG: hypothetical protein AB4063_15215 [Crocosphaera sp.]
MFFKRKVTKSLNYDGDIILIGPLCSGKSTFLAALSALNMAKNKSPYLKKIDLRSDDSEKLLRWWTDIVMRGVQIAGTSWDNYNVDDQIDRLAYYGFRWQFEVPDTTLFSLVSKQINLEFSLREVSGSSLLFRNYSNLSEILLESDRKESYEQTVSGLTDVTQIFILFDALSSNRDKQYAEQITFLENTLNQKLSEKNKNKSNYRIAIGFYKFEQSYLYLYHHKLTDFIERKFYHLQTAMNRWKTEWNCSVEYFACSGYGMIQKGDSRKPNCQNPPELSAKYARLKNPEAWQPFGLIAPIYWLVTGEKDERIDDI